MNPIDEARVPRWAALCLAILVAGALLRLLHLDADPVYRLWAGYVTDEGRWTEQARRFVLEGAWETDSWASLHLLLAPLFQTAAGLSFSGLGVGLASARLVSALSGVFLLGAVYQYAKRDFPGPVLMVTMLILAFQPDLLFFGRVAIPEMSATLFALFAFVLVSSHPESNVRMLLGGLLTVVAIGFKLTVAPLALIFMGVAWAMGEREGVRRRAIHGLFFVGGLTLPAVFAGGVLALFGGDGALGWLVGGLQDLTYFLRLETPYEAVAAFVYGDLVASMSPLLLAAWLVGGLLIGTGRSPRGLRRNIYYGSLIWVVGWLGVSTVLDYFPDRYFIHVFAPLALNIGAGLAVLHDVGIRGIREGLDELRGLRRPLLAFWLAFPLAMLLLPALVGAGDLAGIRMDRLRHYLSLVLALDVGLGWMILQWWGSRSVLRVVGLLLLMASLQWIMLRSGVISSDFWQPGVSGGAVWGLAAVGAVGLTVLAWNRPEREARTATGIFGGAIIAGWLWMAVPQILAPTYTIREAADLVEEVAQPGDRVGTKDAGGVLLDTSLRYTEKLEIVGPTDLLIVAFDQIVPSYLAQYRLIARSELNLGPEIDERRGSITELKVYRLREGAPATETAYSPSDS